jgi:allantoinase
LESGNLLKAWGGIAGIQFLLPASWTALKDRISLEQFIPLLTEHPAKFIGASTKGKIEKGFDADLMIWNPDAKKIINAEEILFRHKISPYIGEELYGTVTLTIVNGTIVFENNSDR